MPKLSRGGRPEREDVVEKALEYIALAVRDPSLSLAVRAVAEFVGVSPQTIYNRDKRTDREEDRLAWKIKVARAERERRSNRVRRHRGAAELIQRIERLETELAEEKTRYRSVLTKLLLVEEAFRGTDVDLDAIYEAGIAKPDRSYSKAGGDAAEWRRGKQR
jgi:hypothetical protein